MGIVEALAAVEIAEGEIFVRVRAEHIAAEALEGLVGPKDAVLPVEHRLGAKTVGRLVDQRIGGPQRRLVLVVHAVAERIGLGLPPVVLVLDPRRDGDEGEGQLVLLVPGVCAEGPLHIKYLHFCSNVE
ncbi:MAG: hypothetical protein ACYC8V_12700 [Caulobacteraceae bacterium]